MFSFNKLTDEIKIIITKKDEKNVEMLEIIRDGKEYYKDSFDKLSPPNLKDISKDIFRKFLHGSINEETSNIIKLFTMEKNKIPDKYYYLIGNLCCNNYDINIMENNFEILADICQLFSNEFNWKLFVAILNFEKDQEQLRQEPLKHLMNLLTTRKYGDFLIDYNKYNGNLERGYIFNFCLLTHAKATLCNLDIIKFLEDIHSKY